MQSPISESHRSTLPAPQISIHQHHGSLAKVIILHPVHGEEILDSKRRPFKQRNQRNNSSSSKDSRGPPKTTTANVVMWWTKAISIEPQIILERDVSFAPIISTNRKKNVVLQLDFCRGHQGHGLYKFPPTSCFPHIETGGHQAAPKQDPMDLPFLMALKIRWIKWSGPGFSRVRKGRMEPPLAC